MLSWPPGEASKESRRVAAHCESKWLHQREAINKTDHSCFTFKKGGNDGLAADQIQEKKRQDENAE